MNLRTVSNEAIAAQEDYLRAEAELKATQVERLQQQLDDERNAAVDARKRLANPRYGLLPETQEQAAARLAALANPPTTAPILRSEQVLEDPLNGGTNLIVKGNYGEYVADQQARGLMTRQQWGNLGLDTPERIDAELLAPVREMYHGADKPVPQERYQFVHNPDGSTGVFTPSSGAMTVTSPPVEKPVSWPINYDLASNKTSSVRMTPTAFAEQFSSLPEYARTNDVTRAQLRAAGFSPNGLPMIAGTRTAVNSGPEKVRVKGPNGQAGRVPKGTTLPKGWTFE